MFYLTKQQLYDYILDFVASILLTISLIFVQATEYFYQTLTRLDIVMHVNFAYEIPTRININQTPTALIIIFGGVMAAGVFLAMLVAMIVKPIQVCYRVLSCFCNCSSIK